MMKHLLKMRTRFQLSQKVLYKSNGMLYEGKVVGLHDDFIFVFVKSTLFKDRVYKVNFEDVIERY